MVDLGNLINGLNLSPVNTVLLAVLLYVFQGFGRRLRTLEKRANKHRVSLAVIRTRLDIPDDDDEDGEDE